MERNVLVAYAAGIVDGEGCVSIGRAAVVTRPSWQSKNPRYYPQLVIAMNNANALTVFDELWGKKAHKSTSKIRGAKCTYMVTTHAVRIGGATKVSAVLTELLPLLREKRTQAEVVLELCDRILKTPAPGKAGLSTDEYSYREALFLKCRALKKRGAAAKL